ncbi:MAG: transcriptional regulator [Woeseiaceae bacterium]
MNEATAEREFPPNPLTGRIFGTRDSRQGSAFYGYSLTTLAIGIGWLLRDYGLINPEEGLGYWLGIIGGSMMLVLLLYPLRKRIKALRFLGGTTRWFSAHMILGIVGPVLVLYHSNFQLGSFNSRVALYCMLLVAGSGVVGRHIYAHIHRGLYGQKISLSELRNDLNDSLENNQGLATLLPELTARLSVLTAEVQGDSITGAMSTRASVMWTLKQYFVWISLQYTVHRELNDQAASSPAIANDLPRLKRTSFAYIRNFVRLTGRVAQFTLYERLFALWHILHMPFFFMMVISALIHVLAVHMY